MKKIIFTSVALAAVLLACKTTKAPVAAVPPPAPPDCSTTAYTYEKDIRPIMEQNCTNCHNENNTPAGYNFYDTGSVKRAAVNGYLLGTIKHQSGYDQMPPNGPLDQPTINKIECWINTGMK
jgi:cytochrome c5